MNPWSGWGLHLAGNFHPSPASQQNKPLSWLSGGGQVAKKCSTLGEHGTRSVGSWHFSNGLFHSFFCDSPCDLTRFTPSPKDERRRLAKEQGIKALMDKQAVVMAPSGQDTTGFYSTLFLVPKVDSSLHPVLNLKGLNKFVVLDSFRMVTLQSIIRHWH